MTGFSKSVRDIVTRRANGSCERCGMAAPAYQIHHRRPRGMGGSTAEDTNRASNSLFVCVSCHSEVEANRSEGLRYGWLVRQGCNPLTVPVLRKGEWVQLDDIGGYTPCAYQAVGKQMGLPWIRLDTSLPTNPKVLDLVESKRFKAAFGYLCSLTYAGLHGTDGFIPAGALPFIHMTKTEAAQLVAVGLWIATTGGWLINGWDEFQVSDEAAKKRRERAQKAAAKRWKPEEEEPKTKGHLRGL